MPVLSATPALPALSTFNRLTAMHDCPVASCFLLFSQGRQHGCDDILKQKMRACCASAALTIPSVRGKGKFKTLLDRYDKPGRTMFGMCASWRE